MFRNIFGRFMGGMFNLFTGKTIWLSLLAAVMTAVIFVVYCLDNVIYIIDGDTTTVTITAERDAMKILDNEEILTTANDTITYETPTSARVGELVIERGFPVSITVDGATTSYNRMDGTVAELFEDAGVVLGAHDKVTHEMSHVLQPYDSIEITRVAYRSYDVEVVLPMIVTYKGTSLLKEGNSEVLTEGTDGLRIDTYDEILENGIVVETIQASSVVVSEPTEELILLGDGSEVSTLDYSDEFPLDENGIPVGYIDVLHNQRATGYWVGGKAWGAWGRDKYCIPGTVAIRPDEIPYGTKMYIRTASGDFIYGYAIANDTGTGLMDDIIDVDLFHANFRESQLSSFRYVDIYILEYNDQYPG